MLKTELMPPHGITAEECCERYIRHIVEYALQNYFGKLGNPSLTSQFAGQLSTLPMKVQEEGISDKSLLNRCGRFSHELQEDLKQIGLRTTLKTSSLSARRESPEHAYLTPDNTPGDIIIDPTIGQFVIGHNNVFVGARRRLRNIILNQAGDEKRYALKGHRSDNPKLFFLIMWGDTSMPLNP